MRMKLNTWLGMATLLGLLAGASAVARAWQSAQGSQSQPPAQQNDKPKTPDVTPLTLDAPAPVSAEEDAAYKTFQGVIPNDAAKKMSSVRHFSKNIRRVATSLLYMGR